MKLPAFHKTKTKGQQLMAKLQMITTKVSCILLGLLNLLRIRLEKHCRITRTDSFWTFNSIYGLILIGKVRKTAVNNFKRNSTSRQRKNRSPRFAKTGLSYLDTWHEL